MVGRRRARAAGAGYTLVTLLVLITVVQVLVAAALPVWSRVIQREKEEEAIFRGLQYAEAIRVFQVRFGRLPVRLEELLEVNPRSIRQLWKDPLTDDGEWALVYATTGGGQAGEPISAEGRVVGGTLGDDLDDDDDDGGELDDGSDRGGAGARPSRRGRARRGDAARAPAGPILGVQSRAEGEPIIQFGEGGSYRDWRFTTDLIPTLATPTGENVPRLHTLWVGRPFPEGLEPLDGSALDELDGGLGEESEEEKSPRRRGRRGRRGRGG